jgi:hypothetical protein
MPAHKLRGWGQFNVRPANLKDMKVLMARQVIWQGRPYRQVDDLIGDDGWVGVVVESIETRELVSVRFGDAALVIDPTDAQWDAAKAGEPIPVDPEADLELADLAATIIHAARRSGRDETADARAAQLRAVQIRLGEMRRLPS